jgi:hypothetical protein
MRWFSFGNKKRKGKRKQLDTSEVRGESNVVIRALTDWMVANRSPKGNQ